MLKINEYEITGRMPMFQRWGRDAIREGRKTQTRRTKGLEFLTYDHAGIPICDWGLSEKPRQYDGKERLWRWQGRKPPEIGDWFVVLQSNVDDTEAIPLRCPYKPGEIRVMREPLIKKRGAIAYRDDGEFLNVPYTPYWPDRWKRETLSQMFMPTAYGRTPCRIEDIKAERLQDISEEDCIAEGSQTPCAQLPKSCQQATMTERTQYSRIWDSINGPGAWELNPYCWVRSFKKLK